MGSETKMSSNNRQEAIGRISARQAPTSDPTAQQAGPQQPNHFKERPRGHRGKVALGVLLALTILTAAVYLGGAFVFSRICYPNTVVAGKDVSLMTRAEAAEAISAATEGYTLTIEGEGFTWSYTPEDPSALVDAEFVADEVIAANDPLAWPIRLAEALGGAQAEPIAPTLEEADALAGRLSPSFDREAFSQQLATAVEEHNKGKTGAFDAVSSYDPELGTFTLEKARSNEKLDAEKVERLALASIATLNGSLTLDRACRVPLAGGATDAELQRAIDAANDLIGADVDLLFGEDVVATLDGSQLAAWITFDDQLVPTLDTGQVDEWVAQLAKERLDTVGKSRTYTRPDGQKITVKGGTYGWVSDEAELVKLIEQAVCDKTTGAIQIPTKQQAGGFTEPGGRDWGAYLDIDLSEQHARYYNEKDELLWESGVITGKPGESPTPTGVYMLNAKDRNSTLIGFDQDEDGEPDYKTPVDYWMPFIGNAVGLHDASWQAGSSFKDPNAYTWTGSHGCVNLPPAKAKELFGIIQVGDCVIVHK